MRGSRRRFLSTAVKGGLVCAIGVPERTTKDCAPIAFQPGTRLAAIGTLGSIGTYCTSGISLPSWMRGIAAVNPVELKSARPAEASINASTLPLKLTAFALMPAKYLKRSDVR